MLVRLLLPPLLSSAIATGNEGAPDRSPPHFLILLADDLGHSDLGYTGVSVLTMLKNDCALPIAWGAQLDCGAPEGCRAKSRSAPLAGQADVATPAIDELAAGGVKLRSFYTWNWCAPSRGALLTGVYAPRNGYALDASGGDSGTPSGVPLRWKFLPQLLKERGYRTIGAGKWRACSCALRLA